MVAGVVAEMTAASAKRAALGAGACASVPVEMAGSGRRRDWTRGRSIPDRVTLLADVAGIADGVYVLTVTHDDGSASARRHYNPVPCRKNPRTPKAPSQQQLRALSPVVCTSPSRSSRAN